MPANFSGGGSATTTVTEVTASTALTSAYDVVLVNNSEPVTVSLPPLASGKKYTISKAVSNAHAVTIDGDGAETIRLKGVTAATVALYLAGDGITLVPGATSWEVIADTIQAHMARMSKEGAQGIPNITDTLIQLDTIAYDIGGLATTGAAAKFTILRTGTYFLEAHWNTGAQIDDTEVAITLVYKNGALLLRDNRFGVVLNTSQTPRIAEAISLVAGDIVQMYVYQADGAGFNTIVAPNQPVFSIRELR